MDREAPEQGDRVATGVTSTGIGRDGGQGTPGPDDRPGKEAAATRRTRRRFARRQWARRWLSLRYVLALLLVLALLGTSIWLVFFSTTLQVKRVEVVGNSLLERRPRP